MIAHWRSVINAIEMVPHFTTTLLPPPLCWDLFQLAATSLHVSLLWCVLPQLFMCAVLQPVTTHSSPLHIHTTNQETIEARAKWNKTKFKTFTAPLLLQPLPNQATTSYDPTTP